MNTPPEITDAMKLEAKNNPAINLFCIDPFYAKDGVNGAIPPEGIIGLYPVDENGEIIPTFTFNPNYIQPQTK